MHKLGALCNHGKSEISIMLPAVETRNPRAGIAGLQKLLKLPKLKIISHTKMQKDHSPHPNQFFRLITLIKCHKVSMDAP